MIDSMKKIHIGTSGWYYEYWKGPYYSRKIAPKDFLKEYGADFPTVEVNNTFYRLPTTKTLRHWKKSVPQSFIFSLKASRYITHVKKLNVSKKSIENFFHHVHLIKMQLGVILFLIPELMPKNEQRLESFIKLLPKEYRYAFEFRDSSWFTPSVYRLLKKYQVAFCIYDLDGKISPKKITTDFVYVRLHGPKKAYCGSYSKKALQQWARTFWRWAQSGKEIFCYFNNDASACAPLNALSMKKMIKTVTFHA